MKIEIVKFDNLGRGIGYIDEKIIFVPKTVPGDIVTVEITKNKKNFYEGKLIEVISPSKIRKKAICPYFDICGGCDLMNISLSEMLDYKLNKVNDYLKKVNIDYKVNKIIKSDNSINYRNKVTLKIKDGILGYYESETHKLIKIEYCYLCNETLNNIIKDINLLNINNGEIIIRCNYNNEILIIINSLDEIKNIEKLIDKHKIVGIVKNDKTIYGENYFIDKINNYIFKVSYNSFFQINPDICSKLFELIENNIKEKESVLDLYCGVGTLSIVASKYATSVLGVEIIENAITDANLNKVLNNKNNIEFICADTKKILDRITNEFDVVLLDPPRSGVSSKVMEKIIDEEIKKIIYVSCNPSTLIRDLKLLLNKYVIKEFKLLDMFPNTEHIESFVILNKKEGSN